jgi:uncharacterized membrane protein
MKNQFYSPALPFREPFTFSRGFIALIGLTTAALSLVVARGILTDNWWFFIMLSWNLFLAFFPLGVVLILRDIRSSDDGPGWFQSNRLLIAGLLTWLAFLPNAPYIITDLFHIKSVQNPLLWFDTMTIFMFAQTGLLAGLYSTLVVHRMIRPVLGSLATWSVVLASQFLSGFGIYLGRFGRWNSWDVLTKPSSLFQAIAQSYHDHLSIKLTLAYGFVLVVLYVCFHWYVDYDRRS